MNTRQTPTPAVSLGVLRDKTFPLSQIQETSLRNHLVFLEEKKKCLSTRKDPQFLKEQAFLSLMQAMRQANMDQGVVR